MELLKYYPNHVSQYVGITWYDTSSEIPFDFNYIRAHKLLQYVAVEVFYSMGYGYVYVMMV